MKARHIVAAVAAALAAAATHADTGISGGYSGLTFTLQDLTPDDGIAASLSTFGGTHSCGWDLGSPCGLGPLYSGGLVPDSTLPLERAFSNYAPLYFISPSVTTGNTAIGAGFELSPSARVTITGSIFVDAAAPSHATKITGDVLWESNTSADGSVSVTLSLRNGGQTFGEQASAASGESGQRNEHPFSFVLESGDTALDFSLAFAQRLTARSPTTLTFITPVPEPESWALLLAGLAVGGALRRKAIRLRTPSLGVPYGGRPATGRR